MNFSGVCFCETSRLRYFAKIKSSRIFLPLQYMKFYSTDDCGFCHFFLTGLPRIMSNLDFWLVVLGLTAL